jgi:hypothetical protein
VNAARELTEAAEKNSFQEGVPAKSIGGVSEQHRTDRCRFTQRYLNPARSYRGNAKRIN